MVKQFISFSDQLKTIDQFPAPRSPKGYPHFRNFFLKAILSSFQETANAEQDVDLAYNAVLFYGLLEKAPTYYLTDELEVAVSNTCVPPMDPSEIPLKWLNVFTSDGLAIALRVRSMDDTCKTKDIRDPLEKIAYRNGIQFKASDAQLVLSVVVFAVNQEAKGSFQRHHIDLIPPYGNNKDTLVCTAHEFGYASDFDSFNNKEICGKSFGEIARLVVNSVLLIKHQPSLISVEKSCGSGQGFSQKPSNDPMPVRWLGKGFSNSRTRSSSSGSHLSPRAHWRRGHWHGYRYGEGHKTLKRKWVQPVYVNPSLLPREDGAIPAADHQPIELY